ncbi:MAG: ImmA/IrrE family metallo-endopeptidase [bacterium]
MTKVKYLKREEIENATLCLLADYGRKYDEVIEPPVPVDAILEGHLGLTFDFDKLSELIGAPDVLGATWIQEKIVLVDQSLDPEEYPLKEGRYRFTLAHELGHWDLHRHLFLAHAGQPLLFGEKAEPSIVCRISSRKEPMEWQADMFSGYLLMPKEMVFAAWEARHGSLEPYVAKEEMADLSARWGLAEDERPTVDIAKDLARQFNVSGQAMQIRLIGLGLIRTEVPAPNLFTR